MFLYKLSNAKAQDEKPAPLERRDLIKYKI